MAKELSRWDTRILWILVTLEGLSALGLLLFFRLPIFAPMFKWSFPKGGLNWADFIQDLAFVGSVVLWLLGGGICGLFLLRCPSFGIPFVCWAMASALCLRWSSVARLWWVG